MPKKIKIESFKYRLSIALGSQRRRVNLSDTDWKLFIKKLRFDAQGKVVTIFLQEEELTSCNIKDVSFYVRGDSDRAVESQFKRELVGTDDFIQQENDLYFRDLANEILTKGGLLMKENDASTSERFDAERNFHDEWAASEDLSLINITKANQACTAPEMRAITKKLEGRIKGARLLDVGCGLGEASVYFASLGAQVTATDLSGGMLTATERLAKLNGVNVETHLSAAEDLLLGDDRLFDIIYMGNLLHHVDIEETLVRIKKQLAPDGILVTWDPLHYNPIINIYRRMATDVRTVDEHPLKLSDLKLFERHFSSVDASYYWLTTLLVFVCMFLFQRRDPNKERFWKVVVQEGESWAWLYKPLEMLDTVILFCIPPLRLLCWNVVLVAKNDGKE